MLDIKHLIQKMRAAIWSPFLRFALSAYWLPRVKIDDNNLLILRHTEISCIRTLVDEVSISNKCYETGGSGYSRKCRVGKRILYFTRDTQYQTSGSTPTLGRRASQGGYIRGSCRWTASGYLTVKIEVASLPCPSISWCQGTTVPSQTSNHANILAGENSLLREKYHSWSRNFWQPPLRQRWDRSRC